MPLTTTAAHRCTTRLTVGALLLALAMTGGCGGGDESTAAIVNARATLASIGVSGTAAPSAARAKAYQDVINAMQAIGGSGQSAASAKIITAQATMGQGEIAAAAQRAAEADVARLTSDARIASELLVKQESLAASLEGHDQSAALNKLRDEVREIEAKLREADAKRADFEAALTQINAKAAERAEMGRKAREIAGQLRSALAEVQGEARLPIVEEAAKHQRDADRFEVEQAGIELEAQAIARQVEEARLDTQRLNRQRDLSNEAIKRVEDSERLLKDQSAAARSQAAATASALSKSFDELLDAVEQSLKPAYAEATGKYNSAASAASAGSAADAGLSKALNGSAQQALAILHAGHAASLESVADVAMRIGSMKNQSMAEKARTAAASLMEQVKAAKEAATSAAAQAGASFSGANVKGPAADVFRKIGERLAPPEQPAEPPADAAPASGDAAPEGAASTESEAPAAESPSAETPAPAADPAGTPEPK